MGLFFNKKETENYEEIITEIKANLSDDKESNLKYLKKMCEKYKKHEMSNEILKEIGRMIFENTSDEKKEELNNVIYKEIVSHLEKGQDYMRVGDLKNAKKELEEFIKTDGIVKEDKVSIPYSPRNPIEFLLCNELNPEKRAKDIGIDYSTGYLRLGSIAIEEKNIDKAVEYLNKSIKFNPYNATARFELIDAYKRKSDLKLIKEEIDKTYKYIYLPNDLGRFYRDLGYYYIEKEEFELAKCLYLYSIQFDNTKNDLVINELQYIFSKTGDKQIPEVEEAMKMITKENIPEFFDKNNIGIVLYLYKQVQADKQENSPVGKFIKNIAEFYLKYLK